MMRNLKRLVCRYPLEMLWELLKVMGKAFLYGWFFYQKIGAGVLLLLPGVWEWYRMGRKLEKRKRQELENQFEECIGVVATSLQAGYSVENGFVDSLGEMETMFGKKCVMVEELQKISNGLRSQKTLEEQLLEMGKRTKSAVIYNFGEILEIAKQRGGNLANIIAGTVETLGEQKRTREEIRDFLAGKKLEAKIMEWVPFAILLYVGWANPGYFQVLYHNLTGIGIMTCALLAYQGAICFRDYLLETAEE